tara:strand:- start:1556 stop:1885 length:330 start_codon:yes stop_codon:yes gene_type:complete
MKNILIKLTLILITFIYCPNQLRAENSFDFYLNDFYKKSDKAKEILKEIEIELKEGSREKVCRKQREAAKLGISANKSLKKAFSINGSIAQDNFLSTNLQRWKSLLNKC